MLLEVYAASERSVPGGNSTDIIKAQESLLGTPPTELISDLSIAHERIAGQVADGDLLAFIGAGDIDLVARRTVALLAKGKTAAGDWREGILRAVEGMLEPQTIVVRDEPLGPKTTIRVGGTAALYAEPANTADLQTLLVAARAANIRVNLLGRGSNLIVPDEGVDGIVIRLNHPHWQRFTCLGPGRYWAGAGLRLKELCGNACRMGEGGFEFLEGIPGTVGGALRMNAGAMGGWMYDRVDEVHLIGLDGTFHILKRSDLHVEYRKCAELEHAIAIGAVLRAEGTASSDDIRKRISDHQSERATSQPREPSAGCIFKNPVGDSAGRIIDELGLKGLRVGDAEVSLTHGNFIINRGHASGSDVIALVRRLREEVRDRRSIELEPEALLYGHEWKEVLG
jgi:UDP-N-acetylenolpyruvoylglucosamine reductase